MFAIITGRQLKSSSNNQAYTMVITRLEYVKYHEAIWAGQKEDGRWKNRQHVEGMFRHNNETLNWQKWLQKW